MSDERPRLKEILIGTVSVLRADSELADLLYAPDDPPANATERQLVHPAWGGPKETPGVELVIEPVATGGEWRGGPLSETTQLQCSVVATESWRDGRGVLALFDIRDRAKAVLESPVAPGVYPAGSGGSEGAIETPDESNRLFVPLTAEVRTHHMVH